MTVCCMSVLVFFGLIVSTGDVFCYALVSDKIGRGEMNYDGAVSGIQLSEVSLLRPLRSKRGFSSIESTENHFPFQQSALTLSGTGAVQGIRSLPEYVYVSMQYFIEEKMRRRRMLQEQRQQIQEQQLRRIFNYLGQLVRTLPSTGAGHREGAKRESETGGQLVPTGNLPSPKST